MNSLVRSITPTGRAVLALGPAALILAVASGWREFSIIGLGAVLSILVGVAFVARPQQVVVTRTLVPAKVTVGESSTGVISVRNNTRRRTQPQDCEDVLGDRLVKLSIPSLKPGQTVQEHYVVPAKHRGSFDVGPVKLIRSDPLGLFRRLQGQGTVEQLLVRPRVHALRSIASGWAKDLDGATSDASPRGSAAFHALREYQFGDDLRHVHWRTSARTGQLMVRHLVDTRRTQEVIVLDARAEIYSTESFEEAVEVAASICASAEQAGRAVTLALPLQPDRVRDERYAYLDRLALVGPVAGASVREAVVVGRSASGASALIIITGESDPQEILELAQQSLRSGIVVIVSIVPNREPQVSVTAGGRVISTPSAGRLSGVWAEAVSRL
jgi:uncharacterized protein (DUF58 family)